jgi:hypothetical protein
MPNIIQQLRAEYEASTQGEWEVYFESLPQDDKIWYVFARDGDRPADECTSVFDCSYVAWEGGGHPPEPADTRFILSAHNKMPLLLDVAEAAVAEWNTHRIWKEADENLDLTDEAWDAVWQRIDAAHDAFRDAIASLLKEKE